MATATQQETTQKAPVSVVGVGASAGGLEALRDLVGALPEGDTMAYVIVPHLSASGKSAMVQLLATTSHLPVQEASDGQFVEGGNVYVIPPNRIMRIEDGHLHMVERPAGAGHQNVIDTFLLSLSEEFGEHAVSVILSGTLSDGRDGTVAIRRGDGFTFAQDARSAQYPEMPRMAVRTGHVDFVLSPPEMGQHLARLSAHFESDGELIDVDESTHTSLYREVLKKTGLDLSQYKETTLSRRLQRRIIATQSEDVDGYLEYVRKHTDEASLLCEDVLIHVTGFYRDTEVWDALEEHVLPEILAAMDQEINVRVWTPACATGQETYSMAILLNEYKRRNNLDATFQIFGTDVSARAIDIARMGTYTDQDLKGIPAHILDRYFDKQGGSWQVSRALRNQCVFATHDITRDAPFSGMDLVSCRNLLIYFGQKTQDHVLSVLHYALKGGGYLLLGTSETVGRETDRFEVVSEECSIFTRPEGIASRPIRLRPVVTGPGRRPIETTATEVKTISVKRRADRAVLDHILDASVLVTKHLTVADVRGEASRYLRMSHSTDDLTLLGSLRGGAAQVRQAIDEVIRTDRPVDVRASFIQDDLGTRDAIVTVAPLLPTRDHMIVTFRVPERPVSLPAPAKLRGLFMGARRAEVLERRLVEMEARNDAMVDDYETTLEQLRLANEEGMSTNEELQSTNEELQTATEESQSTAEELRTLNDELRERTEAVQSVLADLTNVLNAVTVPVLVIDRTCTITRLNRAAASLFGFSNDDIGRSLLSLKSPFDELDLGERANAVAREVHPDEFIATAGDQSWHVAITPYQDEHRRVDGTVIVANPVEVEAAQANGT